MPNSAWQQKDRDKVIQGLADQGADIRETKHTHLAVFENGARVGIPKTPSDYRSVLNARAEVRRAGYDWPLDTGEHNLAEINADRRAALRARVAEAVDAITADGTAPDVPAIRKWLAAHGHNTSHGNRIKDALRDLGWTEIQGPRLGRGYHWLWVRTDDNEENPVDNASIHTRGETTIEWVDGTGLPAPDDTPKVTAADLLGADPTAEPLPAVLSPDAELMLHEAERMEKRALDAEHKAVHLQEEVARLQHQHQTDTDLLAHLQKQYQALVVTHEGLGQEHARLISQMHTPDQADDSWIADIQNHDITLREFINGAAAYGLVPEIRLRHRSK